MNRAINRQWRLAARPIGMARESDLEWREEPIPVPGDGQVLVRNVYLSLDPTNRVWMNEADSYMPSVRIGEVMRGLTLSVVEQSRYPKLTRGDLVMGLLGWQDFAVADGSSLSSLEKIQPLTAYLGLFNPIIGRRHTSVSSTSQSPRRVRPWWFLGQPAQLVLSPARSERSRGVGWSALRAARKSAAG